MSNDPATRLLRKVRLARLGLTFERLWGAAFPAVMTAGLALLFVVSGAAQLVPVAVRLGVLAVMAILFVGFAFRLLGVKLPSAGEALARLERDNQLKHRPATSWLDTLALGADNPDSRVLWIAHKNRLKRELDLLKSHVPRSPLPARDPMALRNGLALGLAAALFLNAGEWGDRVAEAVSLVPQPTVPARVDAWISPPAYTGRAPVLLSGEAQSGRSGEDQEFLVPEGSSLTVRINGARDGRVTLYQLMADGERGAVAQSLPMSTPKAGDAAEARAVLQRPVHAEVSDGSRMLGSWRIALIPDAAPQVEVDGDIAPTPTGAFAVPWRASDDYGVVGIDTQFRRVAEEPKPGQPAAAADSPFLKDAPGFAIALQKMNPREAKGRAFQDLTAHPWAGLMVDMTLVARDQAGQRGLSQPVRFRLPERQFSKPLASALVEQRKVLIRTPAEKSRVVRSLAALMAWPQGLFESSGSYMGVRMAASRLYDADNEERLHQVIDLLWEIAISVEDGALDDALKNLESLRKELQKALAEGAPPDKIADLMRQLREAMNKYLEAMQKQALERMRQGGQPQQRPGKEVRSEDLQKMLDQIENLAKQGSRDAAQEMLAQLENLLKNLQPGMANDMQRGGPMDRMLDQLGDMMRRQQQLMDETFRLPQGQQGQPGTDEQGQPGQEVRPGQQGRQSGGRGQGQSGRLAEQQGELGRALDDLLRQLGEQGMDQPGGLGRARRSMDDAKGALEGADRDRALGSQNDAMQALREGAQSMARDMMQQQGTGNQGNYGRHGEARGDDRDPLGRPMPRSGEDYGPDRNMLPGEAAIEQARRILDYLRNRSNEPNRPKVELDYFDRLLRGLY
jgi:uncharacterized protein (TIGR02302 family)